MVQTPQSRSDPTQIPAYSFTEAGRYLGMPVSTARSWLLGLRYQTQSGKKKFHPIIRIADPKKKVLSFQNLVELHVLSAVRRKHGVRLSAVRTAVKYLEDSLDTRHPLSDVQMFTDGTNLFVDRLGRLINASRAGQVEMASLLQAFLRRVDRDPQGIPIRLYPVTRREIENAPASVVIDPRVQFGRPCLVNTGIPTAVLGDRLKAGESIESLAADYGRDQADIEEAIRYELQVAAA